MRQLVTILILLTSGAPLAAQETLERTPLLDGGWVGQAGMLYANLSSLVRIENRPGGRELVALPGLELGFGLPRDLLIGARVAPQSTLAAGRATEWEISGRYQPFAQARGRPVDAAATVAWNGAASSVDGELSVARWMGPARVIGSVRGMSNAAGGDPRLALAAGGVLHPRAGSLPIAIVGDLAMMPDAPAGVRAAWSAGVQIGVSFTDHTLSLFATNTEASTLQSASFGSDVVRWGLELTVPIPVARFVGWTVPRAEAGDAVVSMEAASAGPVHVEIGNYLFLTKRVEVERGSVVEWRNTDGVLHTVASADGAWESGPIEPGEVWRARFDRPGRYLYDCGPHPFMKGEIIVR